MDQRYAAHSFAIAQAFTRSRTTARPCTPAPGSWAAARLARMGRLAASLQLPRMEGGVQRGLRVRADERLAGMLISGQPGDAARLEVPSRETVAIADRITVEVGFGALADEVELDGEVVAVRPQDEGAPNVVVIAI